MAESTAPTDVPIRELKRARASRRLGLTLVSLLLIAGIAGLLGVRTATKKVRTNDLELSVNYARVSRPGLATPWSLTVRSAAGFEDVLIVRASSDYFAMFDENGLDPDPASATSDENDVIWTFDPPPEKVFTLSFDARIEPGVQWGREGEVSVSVGNRSVSAKYKTWVLP